MDDSGRLHYPTRSGKDFLGLTYEESGVLEERSEVIRPRVEEGNRAERRAAKSDRRRIIPRGPRYENA